MPITHRAIASLCIYPPSCLGRPPATHILSGHLMWELIDLSVADPSRERRPHHRSPNRAPLTGTLRNATAFNWTPRHPAVVTQPSSPSRRHPAVDVSR